MCTVQQADKLVTLAKVRAVLQGVTGGLIETGMEGAVVLFCVFVLFGCYLCCSIYCLCVNVYCHRVTTQLQLIL